MKPGIPNSQRILQEIIAERERLTGEKSKEKLQAYKICFGSPEGKKVLADLKASYGGISFVPGYADVTAFNEGRRSVADDIETIIAMMEAMPELSDPGGG
ncbi:MAG: hypothetical protein M0T69_02000 [Deltaproteobacteria bacterium]|nr:hypothetical protein [Deltaproteobacteria bacterium]